MKRILIIACYFGSKIFIQLLIFYMNANLILQMKYKIVTNILHKNRNKKKTKTEIKLK
jgi:hypothetical protein